MPDLEGKNANVTRFPLEASRRISERRGQSDIDALLSIVGAGALVDAIVTSFLSVFGITSVALANTLGPIAGLVAALAYIVHRNKKFREFKE